MSTAKKVFLAMSISGGCVIGGASSLIFLSSPEGISGPSLEVQETFQSLQSFCQKHDIQEFCKTSSQFLIRSYR